MPGSPGAEQNLVASHATGTCPWGTKFRDPLLDEDLQVFKCRKRCTCHKVDDIFSPSEKLG